MQRLGRTVITLRLAALPFFRDIFIVITVIHRTVMIARWENECISLPVLSMA